MSHKLKENILNKTFIFLSITIIPLSIFAPLGMWIPLLISSVVLFFLEEKKNIFFKLNSNLEKTSVVLIGYIALSLFWTINFKHALEHIFHICILFFSFRVVMISSYKVRKTNKIKYCLYFSLILSAIIAIFDIYFNLGIKALLLYLADLLNNISSLKEISLKDMNIYNTGLRKGMYSGLYSRGISVIAIFTSILLAFFYRQKFYIFLLLLISSTLILVGESNTVKTILLLSILTFIFSRLIKRNLSFLFIGVLSIYILFCPILLDLTNEEEWNYNYKKLNNELLLLKDKNLNSAFSSLLKGNISESNLYFLNLKKQIYLKLHHRQMIWSFTSNEIKKKPLIGHGFSSSRKKGEYNQVILDGNDASGSEIQYFPAIPLHPHNNTLQVWLELGLVGSILYLLLYFFIWKELLIKATKYPKEKIFLYIAFISVFLINQVSFGLWQTWWLASIAYFIIFVNLFLKKELSRSFN